MVAMPRLPSGFPAFHGCRCLHWVGVMCAPLACCAQQGSLFTELTNCTTRASLPTDLMGSHAWPWLQAPQRSGRRVCCRRWCWGTLTCRTRLRLRYEEEITYSLSCCQAIVLRKYLAHAPSGIRHVLGATHPMSAHAGCLYTACNLVSHHKASQQPCPLPSVMASPEGGAACTQHTS